MWWCLCNNYATLSPLVLLRVSSFNLILLITVTITWQLKKKWKYAGTHNFWPELTIFGDKAWHRLLGVSGDHAETCGAEKWQSTVSKILASTSASPQLPSKHTYCIYFFRKTWPQGQWDSNLYEILSRYTYGKKVNSCACVPTIFPRCCAERVSRRVKTLPQTEISLQTPGLESWLKPLRGCITSTPLVVNPSIWPSDVFHLAAFSWMKQKTRWYSYAFSSPSSNLLSYLADNVQIHI